MPEKSSSRPPQLYGAITGWYPDLFVINTKLPLRGQSQTCLQKAH